MKLKIELSIDNDAFQIWAGTEVTAILARVAAHLNLEEPDRIALLDSNGNTVGSAETSDD